MGTAHVCPGHHSQHALESGVSQSKVHLCRSFKCTTQMCRRPYVRFSWCHANAAAQGVWNSNVFVHLQASAKGQHSQSCKSYTIWLLAKATKFLREATQDSHTVGIGMYSTGKTDASEGGSSSHQRYGSCSLLPSSYRGSSSKGPWWAVHQGYACMNTQAIHVQVLLYQIHLEMSKAVDLTLWCVCH